MHFVVRHAEPGLHHLVRLADHLHVTVLDTIVNHFHKVPCPATANPIATRFALVGLGTDRLEDGLHVRPGIRISTRHDTWTFEGSFFTAGDTGSDVQDSFRREIVRTANRIGELAVATIDDDVALFKERQQTFDHCIDRTSGFDHDHDATWTFQLAAKLFQRMRADDRLAAGSPVDEIVNFGSRTVVNSHGEVVAGHVKDKVFAHHGESNQSDICV